MALNIQQAFDLVVAACNDSYIGYSNDDRTTIKLGVTYRTYCDCSSLMSWACYNAGAWNSNPWFSTIDEPTLLQAAGFTRYRANAIDWEAGDILTRGEGSSGYSSTSHTEMVYQSTGRSGYTMGAHTSRKPFPDQVSINTYLSDASSWDYIYKAGGAITQIYHWTQRNTNSYGALTSDEIYTNAILTWAELRKLGFSDAAAAGVMGNIEHEGQFNPAQWEGTAQVDVWNQPGKGYGMFQYTPPTKYKNFADYKGITISDPDQNGPCQIQWLDDDSWYNSVLGGYNTSQFTGTSYQMAGLPQYGITYSEFKQLTDPAVAANVWMRAWEKPGDPDATQNTRTSSALQWYYEIINNFPKNIGFIIPASNIPWIPGMINNLRWRKVLR